MLSTKLHDTLAYTAGKNKMIWFRPLVGETCPCTSVQHGATETVSTYWNGFVCSAVVGRVCQCKISTKYGCSVITALDSTATGIGPGIIDHDIISSDTLRNYLNNELMLTLSHDSFPPTSGPQTLHQSNPFYSHPTLCQVPNVKVNSFPMSGNKSWQPIRRNIHSQHYIHSQHSRQG